MKPLLLAALCALTAAAQEPEPRLLEEFSTLLKLPNTADNPAGLRRNAEWIRQALARRGVTARLLELPGAAPAVFGELKTPGARQTVVVYAHYDGQAVDASQWQPSGPFDASLRGGAVADPETRVYARSASDDKVGVMCALAGLDAVRAAGAVPSVNLKFFFEGEEEIGSTHLGQLLEVNKTALAGDFWLIVDGPVHQSRRMQVDFGARGFASFELTVYGPRRELHSGHYGNWAPNPAMDLARLITSLRDDNGRVLVKGFYDDVEPLSAGERAALAKEPPVDANLRQELLLGRQLNSQRPLAESINEPSLNVRGLASAAVGDAARNVVPAKATASIDMRLVKANDPVRMLDKVKAHVRAQGYYLVEGREPSEAERLGHPRVASLTASEDGYRAVRTPMDLPVSRQVIAALTSVYPDLVQVPTLGGSVPLALIEDILHVPTIGIPLANHDNNQHSHNENLRLANLWMGVQTMRALYTLPDAR